MRRWMKRIGIICLIPMVLVILISILLYIPPFQNFAVRLATEYASETTGMNIRIGQIRLSFPLNLTIRDVKVITPPDTLLSLESFQVNIRPLPLLKKEVLVDAIDLRGVKANTGNLIEGMEIKGTLGKLYAKADRIDLGKDRPAEQNRPFGHSHHSPDERHDNKQGYDIDGGQLEIDAGSNRPGSGSVCHADTGRLAASFDLYRKGWINRRDSRPRIGTLQCIPVSAVRLFPELRR